MDGMGAMVVLRRRLTIFDGHDILNRVSRPIRLINK